MSNNNGINYETLTKEFKFIDEFDVPLVKDSNIKKFIHKKSGITLLLNYCPGPKCNANIVVPTESFNNKGLQHTLEHLIFTGCEDIPYREFLEVLSNRCLSAPTNAYTSEDHTCYSLESVGPEGILTYLPQYLKFILTPTLKDSDFVTEVYHLDSNGKDQGVVLCEMQARENTSDDLLEFNMCKNIFEGCGYQYSYGGLTAEIATLTNQMVRDYHGKFYIPKFMTIIIQGCIDMENIFKVLDQVEFKSSPFHVDSAEDNDFIPWKDPIPPLLKSKSSFVPFPSESDTGSVSIGWRGPSINDTFTINALSILLRYFQDNSSSPFNQRFVNKTIPIASSVYGMVHEVKETKITIEFSGLSVKYKQDEESLANGESNGNHKEEEGKEGAEEEEEEEENDDDEEESEEESEEDDDNQDSDEENQEENEEDVGDNNLFNEKSIYNRLISLFKEIREKGFPEKDTMKKIIDKEYIKTLEGFEEDPLGTIFSYLLTSAAFPLIGTTDGFKDVRAKFQIKTIFDELKEKPDEYWFDLIDRYFIDAPYVEIILKPDSKLSETIAANTIQRQKDICEKYGEEGMKKNGELVKQAIETNKSFPEEFTHLFPKEIFDIKKIPLPKLETQLMYPYTNENPNPYAIQKVLVNTHFLHTAIVFYAQNSIPDELRPFITLFQLITYETDLKVFNPETKKKDITIPYKQVSQKLSEEVLSYEAVLGFSNNTFSCSSAEIFRVTASCQVDKYDRLLYWVLNMLFNFSLTPKRLLSLIPSFISNLNDMMNDSTQMLGLSAIYDLATDKQKAHDTNISVFKQKEFLKSIQAILKGNDEKEKELVISKIMQVRDCILSNPEAMFVQVSLSESSDKSIDMVKEFTDQWSKFLSESNISQNKKRKPTEQIYKGQPNVEKTIPYFQPLQRVKTKIPSPKVEQLIMRGSESNNLIQYVPLPITSLSPDYPAINLLCNIFNSKEGEIRKKGYAYSHSLTTDLTRSCLVFCLIESASPIKALEEFYKWLKAVESNPTEIINKLSIETAVCVEIYDFYSIRSTPNEIIIESYINVFKGLKSFHQSVELLNRFKSVTFEQIMDVFNRYFKPFLDQEKIFLMLTTNPSSNKQIETELKEALNYSIDSKYPSDLILPFNPEVLKK
ncbi:hypothetical protein DICPUDRAFT_94647 [Dictyostelium purpureum]|uniref:Peptidase M16 N-terminal domain-containing protein n=1 Tax=Dictyostelium purpureum TaxID=5786 RepID=F0ZLZ0_DICPU|nr:uncharacterized protein DICPUDRAFT_94647 [Dictyostelium purpureum]EGC35053.1 hypothetical protein DICPUDRAFT_94647 [Dictyostelium purpureum]|eukprot:XP_003288421.1 hypothetical protein DICPUDRAFT_94647 [Dictyostelium purpureum]